MSAPRRLVLVGPLPPPYYGQSVSFGMLVREVAERGIPHDVVDLAHGEGSEQKIGRASWERAAEYTSILTRYARVVAGPRRTVYLTIAQSRHGFFRDCVMIWLAALRGHPVVVHLKGGNYGNFFAEQPGWLRRLIRATLRRTSRVLVLGERLRGMFDFEPLLRDRVHVVPNGLPEDRLEGAGPQELPAHGPVRLLYLSNLIESKGYLDVLAAVRLLRDRLGEGVVRCDFYGAFMTSADDVTVRSPEHGQRLFEEYVTEHRLEGCVGYHGVVSGEEKRRVLARSQFFLLPTRYNNEGQPVSIIEALAYGAVVVSTDHRAIPDMVVDGATGFLVPFGEPEAIAERIGALIGDPARFAAMSRATVDLYERGFTRQAHLNTLLPHLLPELSAARVSAGGRAAAESAPAGPVAGAAPRA